MDAERWQRIEHIYHSALALEDDARSAFVREACGGDENLRREVESLIAYSSKSETFLETPAVELTAKTLTPERDDLLGKEVGPYKIGSLLGVGGMGRVYKALDTRLERTVALKVLSSEVTADQLRMKRFVKEAKAASAISHPNIATVYELGHSNGVHFIAMEYVEGETLEGKIKAGPMQPSQVMEIAIQAAEALQEAHSKGVIHRDIKPSNLMLTPRGQVKILDFGIAKFYGGKASDNGTATTSAPGVVLGTLDYMSPEQLRGRPVDPRTDLFSLGATLYEMASGRKAFSGSIATETIDRILHAQPDAIAGFNDEVSPALERVVLKMLAKERASRYQSAAEVRVDLLRLKYNGPTSIPFISAHRRLLLITALAAAMSGLIWFAGIFTATVPDSAPGDSVSLGDLSQLSESRLLERANALASRWAVSDNQQAIRFLEELVRRNPDNAMAHSALALEKLKRFWWYQADSELLAKVVDSASWALQLDPQLVQAEAVLIIARTLHSGDPELYLQLTRCLQKNPRQPEALGWLAYNFCAKAGQFGLASKLVDRLKSLSPQAPYGRFIEAFVAIQKRDFASVRKQIHQIQLEFPDSDAAAYLSVLAGISSGNAPLLEAAIREYEMVNPDKPSIRFYRAYLQSLQGTVPGFEDVEPLRQYLEADHELSAIYAQIQARLSRPEEALQWLEHSVSRGNYDLIQMEHADFELLARDPRYFALKSSLQNKIQRLSRQIQLIISDWREESDVDAGFSRR